MRLLHKPKQAVSKYLKKYDRMDCQSTAKLYTVLLLCCLGIELCPIPISALVVDSIECICSGIDQVKYALRLASTPPRDQICGSGELDHCTCDVDGEIISSLDIPHIDWMTDFERISLELDCNSNSDTDTAVTRYRRSADETDEKETTYRERKTNLLSRTIKGTGDIASSVGNLVSGGVNAIGSTAGGAINGSFHLVGTAFKKISETAGSVANSVGSVFEGSKTITKEEADRHKRSIETEENSVETPDEEVINSARQKRDTLAIKKEVAGIIDGGDALLRLSTVFHNVAKAISDNDSVETIKAAITKYKDQEKDKDCIEVYETYLSLITPEMASHQIDDIEVIAKLPNHERRTGVWSQIMGIKDNLVESEGVLSFITRMSEDPAAGEYEKRLAKYLEPKVKEDLTCDVHDDSAKIVSMFSVKELLGEMQSRSKICGNDDFKAVLEALQAIPKGRTKRSVDKKIKKKPKKKRHSKKSTEEHEHSEHDHKDEEPDHEEEEHEEDGEQECKCDPDTGAQI